MATSRDAAKKDETIKFAMTVSGPPVEILVAWASTDGNSGGIGEGVSNFEVGGRDNVRILFY